MVSGADSIFSPWSVRLKNFYFFEVSLGVADYAVTGM